MSPWKRRLTAPIPVVPDDAQERKRAIEQSAQGLKEALQQVPEAMELVSGRHAHDAQNHYAIRIRESYGGTHI